MLAFHYANDAIISHTGSLSKLVIISVQ